jgi:putative SOS response-associated peptidase YedK
MRWGLVPSWSQDRAIGQRMINARAETLLERPSFKQLVSTRRCLVPADGFFEWRREGNRKVPMWFYLKSRKPFAFPGLWDCWLDRDTGSELYTFTIITTRANGLVRRIHDRMPVIYDPAMDRQWLDGPFGSRSMALDFVLNRFPPSEYRLTRSRRSSIALRTTRWNASNQDPADSIGPSCRSCNERRL